MSESSEKTVEIRSPVMEKNDRIAEENRRCFDHNQMLAMNIISSPGAGKTTLLERTAEHFGKSLAVIEGDVQTRRDSERVAAAGADAWQIETGGSCHLDALAVSRVLADMNLEPGRWPYLVVENVGNLICPSSFHLGEHLTAGILSVPEGDDKVLKYPALFSRIDLMIVNKIDLLEHLDFDPRRAAEECRSLNPEVRVIEVSARTGEGLEDLFELLEKEHSNRFG